MEGILVKKLACSHIFIISKDHKIKDMGDYSYERLHISHNYAKEIQGDDFIGKYKICRIPEHTATLVIDSPTTDSKHLFISTNPEIPITNIFSRSNPNGDCIIRGDINTEKMTIECVWGRLFHAHTITLIDPYQDFVQDMPPEPRYVSDDVEGTIQKKNRITERTKAIEL